MRALNRLKSLFKMVKTSRIFFILIGFYLLIILVLSIKTSYELKKEGVFSVARIVEIKSGSYITKHVKYEFIENNEIKYGQYSFFPWEDSPVIGKYYLNIYLKDKNYLNFLFVDVELPDTFNLNSEPTRYIPKNPRIKFWKI
ncbi:hypothetical protein [Aquimarina sp. 2201CG5-10]|uniref:hypothetical protein n=1 Tax=Aquimarina callyspongiae TaxID=3098150 RepID=UPI002AB49820|nr:hypothetical protein [Aquimarina sp. 2201CG5-10]MDY8138487.1 hypothetical protein [Aquimarina sp. 2201CG5-10]